MTRDYLSKNTYFQDISNIQQNSSTLSIHNIEKWIYLHNDNAMGRPNMSHEQLNTQSNTNNNELNGNVTFHVTNI